MISMPETDIPASTQAGPLLPWRSSVSIMATGIGIGLVVYFLSVGLTGRG